MSPWLIFLGLLGPFFLFATWVIIAQLRGRFNEPEPKGPEPDIFQRHATLIGILLVLGGGLLIWGVSGLIAAGILLFFLSLVTAVIMTIVQSVRHRSRTRASEVSGDQVREVRLDSIPRRFVRNFRTALTEWPAYWP